MTALATVLAADSVSGWDKATAIGTIAAAAATAVAVVAALVSGAKDRRAAERAVTQQIAANIEAQQTQLKAARDERRREHLVDVLLSLQEQAAIMASHRGAPQSAQAVFLARGLILALPFEMRSRLTAVTTYFSIQRSDMPSFEDAYPNTERDPNVIQFLAHEELANEIKKLA